MRALVANFGLLLSGLVFANFSLANIAQANVAPLGNVAGYILQDIETQYPFEFNEGQLVDCILETGLPTLKIDVCTVENGSVTINGNTFVITKLVRNFYPNAANGRVAYNYQYIGVWEKKLPDFTLRYNMLLVFNLPGLNTPRFRGYIEIYDMDYTKQLVAKKI